MSGRDAPQPTSFPRTPQAAVRTFHLPCFFVCVAFFFFFFPFFLFFFSPNLKLEPFTRAITSKQHSHQIRTIKLVFMPMTFCSFLLQKPCSSVPEIIKLMRTFSSMSNYSINWHKSSILSLHRNRWDVATPTQPLPLCTGHITYLGINISPRISAVQSQLHPATQNNNEQLKSEKNNEIIQI